GVVAHLVERTRQLDAARLAAATRVDLGLDHPEITADGLGGLDRLLRRTRHAPRRHRDAVFGKQLLGLIFVEVHAGIRVGRVSVRPRSDLGPGRYAAPYSPPCVRAG